VADAPAKGRIQSRAWLSSASRIVAVALFASLFLLLFQLDLTDTQYEAVHARQTSPALHHEALALWELHGPLGLVAGLWHEREEAEPFQRYAQLMRDAVMRGGNARLPYRDVAVECPPAALAWLALASPWADDFDDFAFAVGLLSGATFLAALLLSLRVACGGRVPEPALRYALWWAVAFALALGQTLAFHSDAMVPLSLAVAAWALELAQRSPSRRGLAWALGAGLTLAAGVLANLAAALGAVAAGLAAAARGERPGRLAWTAAAAFAAGVALPSAALAVVAGDGLLDSFRFRAASGVQIESTWSGLLMLGGVAGLPVSVTFGHGSYNVQSVWSGTAAALSPVATLGALLAVSVVFWRSRGPEPRAAAELPLATAFLLAVMLGSRALPPQFLIWVAPMLGAIAAARPELRPAGIVFLAAALFTQLVHPQFYGELRRLEPVPVALLLARNGLLLVALALLVRGLWTPFEPLPMVRWRARVEAAFAWFLVALPAARPPVREPVVDLFVAAAAAAGLWAAVGPGKAEAALRPATRLALVPIALLAAFLRSGIDGLATGLLLGLGAFLLAEPARLEPGHEAPPARGVPALAIGLVLAASVARALLPATPAALAASVGAVGLAPGLALGLLLLAPGSSWPVRLAWAPLLSLAPQLLGLLWLNMLDVPVSAAAVALLPAGLTLAVIAVDRWPRRTEPRGAGATSTATRP
jgi:hypothetical protein